MLKNHLHEKSSAIILFTVSGRCYISQKSRWSTYSINMFWKLLCYIRLNKIDVAPHYHSAMHCILVGFVWLLELMFCMSFFEFCYLCIFGLDIKQELNRSQEQTELSIRGHSPLSVHFNQNWTCNHATHFKK